MIQPGGFLHSLHSIFVPRVGGEAHSIVQRSLGTSLSARPAPVAQQSCFFESTSTQVASVGSPPPRGDRLKSNNTGNLTIWVEAVRMRLCTPC